MNHVPSLPQSSLFETNHTPYAGRSIFAKPDIAAHTLLFETCNIIAHVIHRPYRKEVCARCFAYHQGRNLPIRPPGLGVVFCSAPCEAAFRDAIGPYGVDAFKAVEERLLQRPKSTKQSTNDGDDDGDIAMGLNPTRPSAIEINQTWTDAESIATQIRLARTADRPSKRAKAAMRDVLAATPNHAVILYVLSGLLGLCSPSPLPSSSSPSPSYGDEALKPDEEKVAQLKQLEAAETPYPTHANLADHATAYCQLVALVPAELLACVRGELVREVAARTARNAFDLRSVDHAASDVVTASGKSETTRALGDATPDAAMETPGAEVLGMGLWPAASFFNHSCAPNLRKKREGRAWRFWTTRNVQAGEELCITYMGGDERELGVKERRERLRDGWGFECECGRCLEEAVKEG